MQKIPDLVKYCRQTGILTICQKSKNIQYGAYGQLILNQIKNEWLRANLTKFETSFLIDSHNLLDEKHTFDIKDFTDSLSNVFEVKKPPFSLMNIVNSNEKTSWNKIEYCNQIFKKEEHFYSDCKPSTFTHLNSVHFCNDDELDQEEITDSLSFWQRERKNWWVKLLNCPENVEMNHQQVDDTQTSSIDLLYKLNDKTKWLENIKYIDDLNEQKENLNLIFDSFIDKNLWQNTKKLIITQTTTHNVLESVLHDCVQFRRKKSEVLKNLDPKEDKERIVFRLDYRLAPFKACILYEKTSNDSSDVKNCYKVAEDLRKLFTYHQINVLMMPFDCKKETLQDKYDKLDKLGMPYTVFLNASLILKDGICCVRNRDTTLEEHLHISLLVNQFISISKALSY